MQEGFERMLKGFKEFLARGNIVDLSIAVVIGTAFTALVTKFTDSIITPLINRIGAGGDSDYGILRIGIGRVNQGTLKPMQNVAMPITIRVSTSIDLRPTRSPK